MTKSKRLIMVITWSVFTMFIVTASMFLNLENLAITGMGSVGGVLMFYLHSETKRPSKEKDNEKDNI